MHGESGDQATSTRASRENRRRRARFAGALLTSIAALALLAASAAAVPSLLSQTPEDGLPGAGAGRMDLPEAIAADPSLPGHVYVADRKNARIDEFTAWGDFVKAWGWGVTDGEAKLETCTSETGCRKGLEGSGTGQFERSEAIAVDSEGSVYVVDRESHRVQKFDPSAGPGEAEADFLLMFGLNVNKTKAEEGAPEAQRNLCTRASGDACQAGEVGSGPGQLGTGNQNLALSTGDNTLFLAEGERIQVFEAGGAFKEEIELPSGMRPRALAADNTGHLYLAFEGGGEAETKARKLEGHGPTAIFLEPSFEEDPEPPFKAATPNTLALDAAGNLYLPVFGTHVSGTETEPRKVLEFNPAGKCLNCKSDGEGGMPGFDRTEDSQLYAIAAGSACGANDVYVAHFTAATTPPQSFLRFFGDHPDPSLCPPPARAPEVKAQYAVSASAGEAELGAQINPLFWDDASFKVEYGTEPCSQGGCATTDATTLTSKVVNAPLRTPSVFLEGLQPGTTYHYRFVAESGGGGPAYGADPDGEGPEEASFEDGLEATFTTYRTPAAQSCPENETFHTGASALLPDCRAYEMVSPLDKEGGDIVVHGESRGSLPAVLNQSALSGSRLAYGSYRSFAGAPSAPLTSQYVASRQAGVGWQTHPISPPRGRPIFKGALAQGDTEFKAFSADLCSAWLQSFAEVPGVPGAPVGVSDLFRRGDEDCGGASYQPLNTAEPPVQPGEDFAIELQGLSADGSTAVFLANDALAEGGRVSTFQLYGAKEGQESFLCVLPGGRPYRGPCIAGGTDEAFVTGHENREGHLSGALSGDGAEVFWTAPKAWPPGVLGVSGGGPGQIYLRRNPMAPQSAEALGSASGLGTLSEGSTSVTALVAAMGRASLEAGSPVATLTEEASAGEFIAGQPLSGSGIAPGTTIQEVEGQTLTLSAPATLTTAPGKPATLTSPGPMPFAVGQGIRAPGIPAGTTITAVKAGELELSKAATVKKAAAPIEAFSQCSEAAKGCTVAVSEDAEAIEKTSGSMFQAAAKDGSRALFTTNGTLYEYRSADGSTHAIAGESLGLLGAGADGRRVYFASGEALGGLNSEGKAAVAGQANLYLYEAEAGQYRFIGALGPESLTFGPLASPPRWHSARVSPDGMSAAFGATAAMTGYDNTDVASGKADAEVYLYDAAANGGAGKLRCASCNPSGSRPQGRTSQEQPTAAQIPAFENNLYAARVLADDGRRLYFESYDALLPSDTNGRRDVYQWEAPGSGSCDEAAPSFSYRNEGCIDLISSGKSKLDSEFIDASPSGSDVFIATLASLVPQDYGLFDIYDARVNGGLPAPQGAPATCEGEACQPPPRPPNDPTPASASFKGEGNVAAGPAASKRCPKGKRRRGKAGKGRCAAKKQAKHKQRTANNKRGGAR